MIYADNAATSKMDSQAFEAMLPWLQTEYANASQAYSFARTPKKAILEARNIIAQCINALPEEIYFTSGGTESDNWVIKNFDADIGEEIITSQIEHHAVLNACKFIERKGIKVRYLPVDNTGTILPSVLNNHISPKTRLVSIMMANNEIGTIEPIEVLAQIAHEYNALFHTDAVQAVGHIPIDVKKLNVDMLSASGHKFNGPKGIGFLYVKKGVDINPFIHGGKQENGIRGGTENIASIVGMATALKINCQRLTENMSYLKELEDLLIAELQSANLDFIKNGNQEKIPGNISLSFKNMSGEMLLHRMDLMGICISTGSACDSQITRISHVIKAINLPEEYALGTVRISLGKDNTREEVVQIANALKKIVMSQ